MQKCTCTVRLRGSRNHEVSNKEVTVPEIRILKHLHGDDAVFEIRPLPQVKAVKGQVVEPFSHDEERQRLVKLYERNDATRGLIGRLFGAYGPLPTALTAIGINPRAVAEDMRKKAADALRAAEELERQADAGPLNEFEQEAQGILAAREAEPAGAVGDDPVDDYEDPGEDDEADVAALM